MSTKERILASSLKLFNDHGVINVRLQHISDDLIISTGNLAYHFRHKENIINALFEIMSKHQKDIFDHYRHTPLFTYLDRIWEQTYHLQVKYSFFFIDTLELVRSYPEIAEEIAMYRGYLRSQLKHILDFNISRGALEFMDEEQRNHLIDLLNVMIQSQLYLHELDKKQELTLVTYKEKIWCILAPYFTHLGNMEYDQMMSDPYSEFFDLPNNI